MKRLTLLLLAATLCAAVRAEMFRPPIVSDRGFRHETLRSQHGDRGTTPVHGGLGSGPLVRGRGPRVDGYHGWHDRGPFWGGRTVFYLGFDLCEPWYSWPFDEPVVVPAWTPAPASAPVIMVQPTSPPAGGTLRDARSPEQLRSIYGAQGEALVSGH